MFADSARIFIKSGKGGNGHVSFRRELFVAAGGPDGGDGGKGGDIIFQIDDGLNTLGAFRYVKNYIAKDGEEGGKKLCHGKDGEDLIIKVPRGTVIKDDASGLVIADMSGNNERMVILKGGRGGKGNKHYATPTMQVPKYAQPGRDGKELFVKLELKVIADVGLVGFPNVGKSTLLSKVSNAKPKIANYHFTTLNPNLGVVDLPGCDGFVIADIPGLIEGASSGIGLGHKFLKHIERTKVIIHLVDAASSEGRDPIDDIYKINNELKAYNADLENKPQIIAANKTDLIYSGDEDPVLRIREEFEPLGIKVFPISAATGKGIKELFFETKRLLDMQEKTPTIFESEFDPAMVVNEAAPIDIYKAYENAYVVEGDKIDRMLGYTNLDDEKGYAFFQNFMKENGIIERLKELGIQEGDTVYLGDFEFDFIE